MAEMLSREEIERRVDSGEFTEENIAEFSRVLGTVEFIRRDRDRRLAQARNSVEIIRATRDAGSTEPVFRDPDYRALKRDSPHSSGSP